MFTKKYLTLIVGKHTLIAIGMVILSLVVIIFLAKEIIKVSDSISNNKRIEASLLERTAHIGKIKYEANLINNNETIISNAFIPSDNIADFISKLESLSLKNSVTQVFRFDSPKETTLVSLFPINTISYNNYISATLPNLIKYMKDFENMHYFTKINGLTITSQTPSGINDASTILLQSILYTKATQ